MIKKLHTSLCIILALTAFSCSSGSDEGPSKPPTEITPPKPEPKPPVTITDQRLDYLIEWRAVEENYTFVGNYVKSQKLSIDDDFDKKIWSLTPERVTIKGEFAFVKFKNTTEEKFNILWDNNVVTLTNANQTLAEYIVMNLDHKLIAIYINLYHQADQNGEHTLFKRPISYQYGTYSFTDFYRNIPNLKDRKGTFIRMYIVYKLKE